MGEVHNEWNSGTVRPPKPVVPDLGSTPAPPPERRMSELAPQPPPAAATGSSMTRLLALALSLVLLVLFVIVLSGRDDTSSGCDWKPGEAEAGYTVVKRSDDLTVYVDGQRFIIAERPKSNGESEHCTIALNPATAASAQPSAGS